eukprot:TRINITY_DN43621_c0_g1_i1.p1 TRINITY_DN43621_c0_g1~~TRINITY_DN43621_c0_g1_i1.p1  ORF type:complete len:428 (+),score=112.69 TRINITY_DN43621_c0_g1_i1:34-1317(+)
MTAGPQISSAALPIRNRSWRRQGPFSIARAAVAGAVLLQFVARPFVLPALRSHRGTAGRSTGSVSARRAQAVKSFFDDRYNYESWEKAQDNEAISRAVKVTDIRDLAALLEMPDPLRPADDMLLVAISYEDGTRLERPTIDDLQKLRPTKLRPVTFHWKDKTREQTKAPKQYDDIIQRLLNAGPADMEELVRANWQQFDKGFYFRLAELKFECQEARLKEKIINLEKLTVEVMRAAQEQFQKQTPQHAEETQEILNSMLEDDKSTLLWPPPPEAYARLAESITKMAVRNKYEDAWFENTLEVCEQFSKGMKEKNHEQLGLMGQIVMQRLITEWLRHDSLWDETEEGRFIFLLMSISHEQWAEQLMYYEAPLDTGKLRDELKIISENKIMDLPMGSKLQIYAAKYIQGLNEFVGKKDDILADLKKTQQ